jgi:hypothetical protein
LVKATISVALLTFCLISCSPQEAHSNGRSDPTLDYLSDLSGKGWEISDANFWIEAGNEACSYLHDYSYNDYEITSEEIASIRTSLYLMFFFYFYLPSSHVTEEDRRTLDEMSIDVLDSARSNLCNLTHGG